MNIDTNACNNLNNPFLQLTLKLHQNPPKLSLRQENVIGPLKTDPRNPQRFKCVSHSNAQYKTKPIKNGETTVKRQTYAEIQVFTPRAKPGSATTPSAHALAICNGHWDSFNTTLYLTQNLSICRIHFIQNAQRHPPTNFIRKSTQDRIGIKQIDRAVQPVTTPSDCTYLVAFIQRTAHLFPYSRT